MAGALGRDHHHINIFRRLDQLEADVETMGEAQHLACGQVRCNFLGVDLFLELVRKQHHDPVRLRCGIGHTEHLESISLGLVRRSAALVETHHHVHTTVLEVQCMGVPLGSIADDRHRLAVQLTEIGIGVVEKLGHPGRCWNRQGTSLRSSVPSRIQASLGWAITRSINP